MFSILITQSMNFLNLKNVSNINRRPRISVNPLCEYVLATASKRNTIIKNCKIPPTFMIRYYNQAEDILAFYLSAMRDDLGGIAMEVSRLKNASYKDQNARKNGQTSADALESFLKYETEVNSLLSRYHLKMTLNAKNPKLLIKGVEISLRPELAVYDGLGKSQIGFVKFYFSKSAPLSKTKGELMACLVREFYSKITNQSFKSKDCMILDVYNGKIFTAPNAFLKRMADIECSCQEIADRWDRV